MPMKKYEKNKKLKYETKDSKNKVHEQIRLKVDSYFKTKNITRNGNFSLLIKTLVLFGLLGFSYYCLVHSSSFSTLLFSFIAFGFVFLILGINIGHDAAHTCVTGNKQLDNLLFQLTFGLQGLSGYVWQIRHNSSHHIFPNVYGNDTDLEISPLILISQEQKKMKLHKYQHLYAPLIYMLFSLSWIFYVDFSMLFKKQHANIRMGKIPTVEIIKLVVIKITYLIIFLVVPYLLIPLPFLYILSTYLIMNFVVSIFLALTFFISHHVKETEYTEVKNNMVVADSWIQHQIVSTIDFSTESPIGNFIFGGFNLHIAHHIFPNMSHIHYPTVTRIIKETLEENNLSWYKSFGFLDGVKSHFSLLKKNGNEVFEKVKTEEVPDVSNLSIEEEEEVIFA